MKAVVNNGGLREVFFGRRLVGPCPVDTDSLNGGFLRVAEHFKKRCQAGFLFALCHVGQFAGIAIENDGDVIVFLANRLLIDEKGSDTVQAGWRRIFCENEFVVSPNGCITDFKESRDVSVGGDCGKGTDSSHKAPSRSSRRMNFLWASGDVRPTMRAATLHGRKAEIGHGTMRHRAIHHGAPSGFVAWKLPLTAWTTRPATFVKVEFDFAANFPKVEF